MSKDLTQGNIFKQIINFCWPLILGNFFQQLYNMVDSIIVGKFVGVDALASIGSTGSLNFLILGFAMGICGGFTIPISQAYGAKNFAKMQNYIANAIFLSFVFIVIMTCFTWFYTDDILMLMQTPSDIYQDAYDYIMIIFNGIIAIVSYNLFSSILRAVGDSKTPLYFLILSSLINVVLDLVFILFFKLEVKGAAYATVISQALSGILTFYYIYRQVNYLIPKGVNKKISIKAIKRLLYVGFPMALQFSITAIGSTVLQTAVNSLGSLIVAAVSTGSKIVMMVVQPLESLGLTLATFGSQNLGAKNYIRIKRGVFVSLLISIVYSVFISLIIINFGKNIALLFIKDNELAILDLIGYYLNHNAYFFMALGVLFLLRNSLQGNGYSIWAMLAGVFEMVARVFVAFVLMKKWGFDAICYANPLAWFAADFLLISVYLYVQKDLKKRCGLN